MIGDYAFTCCDNLLSVTIGSGVQNIHNYVFTSSNLISAYFLGNAPILNNGVFDGTAVGFTIYHNEGASGYTNPWYGYNTHAGPPNTPTPLPASSPTPTDSPTPTATATPTVIATPTQVQYISLPSNSEITDSLMDPSQPIIYAVDKTNKKVYAVNYETNNTSEMSFTLEPERLAFSNGKLYVTLLKAPHYSNVVDGNFFGAVAIINATDFSFIKQIDVDTDPYDIVVLGDVIYLTCGSGQWTYIKSYSEPSKQLISGSSIHEKCYADFNTLLNRIYTITTNSHPRGYNAYNINNGVFNVVHDSSYQGDGSLCSNFRVSPDGCYLFNGSGLILTCDADANKDMNYYYTLNKPFSDVAFDMTNNTFYTSVLGKIIYSYDYNTLNGKKTYNSFGDVSNLYFRDNVLIALSKTTNNQYIIEKIDTTQGTVVAQPTVSTIQLTMSGTNYNLNYNVSDSLMHPNKPQLFIIDSTNNKIASINYETGVAKEISTFYTPQCIAYYNNEIYIGFGQQGKIEIYNDQTFELKDVIFTGATFFDLTIGNDGFIYTSSEHYTRSFSRSSKQEVSNLWVFERGYLEVHPILNSIYFTSQDRSPADLFVVNYCNGILTKENDSPYHGDYSLYYNNKISPDGKYIFNGSGNIFYSSAIQSEDMKYFTKLNKPFSDIAFDIPNNAFYTSVSGKFIYSYDYNTFIGKTTYNSIGNVSNLYYRDNVLIAISKANSNQCLIEKISTTGETITPKPTVSATDTPTTTIIANSTPSQFITLSPNAVITDSLLDPSQPIIYVADKANKKVYAVNYETNNTSEMSFALEPERLAFSNGKLYVTLLKAAHNSYIFDGNLYGAVAIINATDFTFIKQIDVDTDPYDIVVLGDVIYLTCGSGQWTYIKSYSESSKQLISGSSIDEKCYADFNTLLNRIYTITTNSSPTSYTTYNINNGVFSETNHLVPYSGISRLNVNFKVSPDGKYLFNGSGVIHTCDSDRNNDMKYFRTLNKPFSDVAFDIMNNTFYTSVSGKPIYSYDYNSFNGKTTYNSIGDVSNMYFKDNVLIALSITTNNQYIIEKINVVSPTIGDVDGDGNITVEDALRTLQALSGRRALTELEKLAADVNKSGGVTAVDALMILQFASGRITNL